MSGGYSLGKPSFGERYIIGNDIKGIRNSFPTPQMALAQIAALGTGQGPAPDKVFLLEHQQGTFGLGGGIVIPDFVWVEGKGPDLTRFIKTAAGPYAVQFGIGSLRNLSVFDLGTPQTVAGAWMRDSASVYSVLKEPFSMLDGLTLNISIAEDLPFTVTFASSDTTAAAIAAKINAALDKPADVIALDISGFLRIGCHGPRGEIVVHPTSTALSVFGWPSTGISGYDTDDILGEIRSSDDVEIILGGDDTNLSAAFMDDDIASSLSKIKSLRASNFRLNGTGYLYPGGLKDLFDCHFQGDNAAIRSNVVVNSEQNSYINMWGGALNNDSPLLEGTWAVNFATEGIQLFLYGTMVNMTKITTHPLSRVNQRVPPYLWSESAVEGVIQTSSAEYVDVVAPVGILEPIYHGRYLFEATFESQSDLASPPRECWVRVIDLATKDVIMEMVNSELSYRSNATSFIKVLNSNLFFTPMVQVRTSVTGCTVSIRRVRVQLWKVG
jgi:hypothetical protein